MQTPTKRHRSAPARVLVAVTMLFWLPAATAAVEDLTPPVLDSLTLSATAVTAPGTIDATVVISDDLSGPDYIVLWYRGPTGDLAGGAQFAATSCAGLTCTFERTLIFGEFAEPGTWVPWSLEAYDNVGNRLNLDAADLAGAGYPTIEVTGVVDDTAPVLDSLTLSAASVVTPGSVDATLVISDDFSGPDYVVLWYRGPSGGLAGGAQFAATSCAGLTCTFQRTLSFNEFAEPGIWVPFSLEAYDEAGNRLYLNDAALVGYPTLEVIGAGDLVPPVLDSMTVSPTEVRAPATAEMTLVVTDDDSGPHYVVAYLGAPTSGLRVGGADFTPESCSGLTCTFVVTLDWPAFSEVGYWAPLSIEVYDVAGNRFYLGPEDLGGYPGVEVLSPLPEGDHYLTYQVKTARNSARFTPAAVGLTDQFGTGTYTVTRQRQLANPVDKNEEGILDPLTHYTVYDVKPVDANVDTPIVEVENQFGTWLVQVLRPERLLTPAVKGLENGLLDAAPRNGAGPNHYLCYRVRVLDGPDGELEVVLDDQFPEPPRLFDVRGLKWLCNPAEKVHGEQVYPVTDAELHLACFGVFPTEVRHQRLFGIPVVDQFGEWLFNTRSEKELCLPSAKGILDDR